MAASTIPYALVVDDEALTLTDAAQILEEAGFRTLTAMRAGEALALLQEHDGGVTLLFTDVEMPGEMNGFDLAREAARRWPEIRILIASGRMNPEKVDLPPSATFIRKPFSAEVVYDRLHELLPDGKKPEALKRAL